MCMCAKCAPLMTSGTFGGTAAGISKDKVADESANSDRQHDPAIVSHEQQHDEERVEDLQGVEGSLDDFAFLLCLYRVPSWPQQ